MFYLLLDKIRRFFIIGLLHLPKKSDGRKKDAPLSDKNGG
jgi:hypothetical protein